jgi:hypothetical protein
MRKQTTGVALLGTHDPNIALTWSISYEENINEDAVNYKKA